MASNKLKQFVNRFREEIQDDSLAYDEIMTLTEDSATESHLLEIEKRYDMKLSDFGSFQEIKALAIEFSTNY